MTTYVIMSDSDSNSDYYEERISYNYLFEEPLGLLQDISLEEVKYLGEELPYEKFLKEWKKHFQHEFNINDMDSLEQHLRSYKLIKYVDYKKPDKDWENINFPEYLKKGKKIINAENSRSVQQCICKVNIKNLYFITDIDDETGPIIIIGSVCMKKWNIDKSPICGICNTTIPKNSKNKLICKNCVSKKCYECHKDIDKNNQYMNKNSFNYYFTPHIPEKQHYGYDPATNKLGISICGDCKTKTHKVCRRCGTDKVGKNRNNNECYYYCYKCREINKESYKKNETIKRLTSELYGY